LELRSRGGPDARDAQPSARRSTDARTQLIEATIDSVTKRGFSRTRFTDVAREAELSARVVNHYFKSKKALFVATLHHMVETYEERSAAAARAAGDSPVAQLNALIAADFDPSINSFKTVTAWYAFWGETRWRADFLRLCSRRNQFYQRQTCALIQQIIDAGEYRDLDAPRIARGLNAMIDGLWHDMLLDPEAVTPDEAKQVCRAFLAKIFPREFTQSLA
jgi:TetR/AcrR family transcriptional regulator, transcriptional repressor of bet genes